MLVNKIINWVRKMPEERSLHITRDHGIMMIGENIHQIVFDILVIEGYGKHVIFIPREEYKTLFTEFMNWYESLQDAGVPFNFILKYFTKKENIIVSKIQYRVPKGSLEIAGTLEEIVCIHELIRSFWLWDTEKNRVGYSLTQKYFKGKIRC